MRLKLLLFSMLLSVGSLFAQDTIRTLIITEARMDRSDNCYVEITNVGTTPIQLANFEFGRVGAWTTPYSPAVNETMMLPARILEPGKSITIASVLDFTEEQYPLRPDYFNERITKKEMWTLADYKIHMPETNGIPGLDSVTPRYQVMETWNGRETWYLEQHLTEIDSVVVDQVGGVFDENGTNYDNGGYDVAGVKQATNRAILMRKYIVKSGNVDFANARGVGADDSEWMAIPHLFGGWEPYRAVYWTFGNHGDYKLDANTLVSTKAAVDFANSKITVNWGVRNRDDFMKAFVKKPGIAWHYDLSTARADSAYASARNGDKLTLYVCGSTLQTKIFDILVAPPAVSANIVVPMFATSANGYYSNEINNGRQEVFGVTVDAAGMDTITNSLFGIPYATPVDTLLKYLEKAPKASWEIVWVDGTKRTAVKNGDKLKVTAENGNIKNYYIKVNSYRPNHNADLAAITWPDIPEVYRGLNGWTQDTIPNFASGTYSYKIVIPSDIVGIPALVAKTQQLNSTVAINRATTLSGSKEQSTITFTVTADDGTTVHVYTVELEKEKSYENTQPFIAEPFISEIVFQDQWSNWFVEIANPGNMVLDLSNYMIICSYDNNPSFALDDYSSAGMESNGTTPIWNSRYRRYVPGYKWVGQAEWEVTPSILVQDLNVNSLVYPGDVFVLGSIFATWGKGYPWFASKNCDVILNTTYNPWAETASRTAAGEWNNHNYFLFKILNDSIKMGLKPATDPNDFELIEVFGMGDNSGWKVGGKDFGQTSTIIRKPEYYLPKATFKESNGTDTENSEWILKNPAYWEARNVGWSDNIMNDGLDIGKHFMNTVTSYKSTITSPFYKVSEGYSLQETIKGMKTGVTVSSFMGNLVKADAKQTLKVMRAGTGELAMNAALMINDTLTVMSADSVNITKYILNVNPEGLSSNAVITSPRYTVTIEKQPKSAGNENAGAGSVKGFEYGTALRTVLANLVVPAGATMTVIDEQGAYVPLTRMNFDTAYVNVTVNDNIYLSVVAENGITEIVYQLIPNTSDNDAFVLSDIYNVVQKDLLIQYVPRGTIVSTLLSNLVPSAGATMKIVDKLGHVRLDGGVADDDKVVVTSKNGAVSKSYFIAKLATQYIQETTYLAYILSKYYPVDQVTYMVAGVSGVEKVSDFLAKVEPSTGATAVVVNKDKVVKTTGDINGDDMVQVTSADGKMMVYYTFGPLTSTKTIDASGIEMYPNPTNDEINVSGVKAGYRIQVYNVVGAVIRDINVQNSVERISLRNQPIGMYMVVVSDNNKTISRFKAVKQ